MSDDDDYLSDKFISSTLPEVAAPRTYSQLRKDALKKSQEKNMHNRAKSRRQRELESREEGLNKSLFERAQEEELAGLGAGNKALAMMVKMGFTPGQPLGRQSGTSEPPPETTVETPSNNESEASSKKVPQSPEHRVEPLPVNEWLGKMGIGVAKRARSPTTNERMAKMAKMEEASQHSFRDRARQEYEDRKAEGQLAPAQRTCSTLDEKSGRTLNVLWLNPNMPETFPSGLIQALALHHEQYVQGGIAGETPQERLRKQMQADALSAPSERDKDIGDDEDEESGIEVIISANSDKNKKTAVELNQEFDPDILEEAVQFLRLQPQDRLKLVLSYLRNTYAYCFYCGTEYESLEELNVQCPGPGEDDHD